MADINEIPRILLVTRCIIERLNGNLLIVKRSSTDSHNKSQWEFAGGKLDIDENLLEGLKREIKEETGLCIHGIRTLAFPVSYKNTKGKYKGCLHVVLFYVAKVLEDKVKRSTEHDAHKWVSQTEILSYDLTTESRKAFIALL